MKQLIQAIEALFTATAASGGDLAKTAEFTLENVNWNETLNKPEPTGHHIVDSSLEIACANSGPDGSSSHAVAQALLAVTDQLAWRSSSKAGKDGPDIEILLRNFAEKSYWIIGGSGDWRVGTKPWFAVQPGDSIYHASGARHAMQTNEQALLTIWLWTSHLDSEVMIVRG